MTKAQTFAPGVADPSEECTAIRTLHANARGQLDDRRRSGREPLFQPAKIITADGDELAAFTRDISLHGVGLLHSWPLKDSMIVLRLHVPGRKRSDLRVKIEWCLPCGDGFYVSGGRFVSMMSAPARRAD